MSGDRSPTGFGGFIRSLAGTQIPSTPLHRAQLKYPGEFVAVRVTDTSELYDEGRQHKAFPLLDLSKEPRSDGRADELFVRMGTCAYSICFRSFEMRNPAGLVAKISPDCFGSINSPRVILEIGKRPELVFSVDFGGNGAFALQRQVTEILTLSPLPRTEEQNILWTQNNISDMGMPVSRLYAELNSQDPFSHEDFGGPKDWKSLRGLRPSDL